MQQNDKFFSAYVDLAVGSLHQNINTILELKTQVKLFEDLVREKDQVISNLDSVIGMMNQKIENFDAEKDSLTKLYDENTKNLTSQYDQRLSDLQSKLNSLEREKESILRKSGHMTTFENQIKSMKREILEKNAEIDRLKNPTVVSSNTGNTNVTSVINTKTKKPQSKPENVDDF